MFSNELLKLNISDYLIEECNIKKGSGNKVAIYFKDQQYTYEQVQKRVNKVANYLVSLNLKPENRIGLYMNDCPEFVFLFFGAIRAGIIPSIINSKLDVVAVNQIVINTGIQYVFTDNVLGMEILNEDNKKDYIVKKIDILNVDIEGMDATFEAVETNKDDVAIMLFTSGSSGKPKGVMHTHINFISAIEHAGKYGFEITEDDVFYCHSSMSFAFGLGATLYLPFAYGASTVLNNEDDMYGIIDLLEKHEITKFVAVPSVYLSLLQLGEVSPQLFAKCRKFVASGEPLAKRISIEWKEKVGKDIISVFGQTETLHMTIANTGGEEHYGSLGKPLKDYVVKIIKENGDEANAFEVGQMFMKGPGFMYGYWNNEKLTHDVIVDGWLKTGDMVYIDDNDYIWYAGRDSDTFKVNGVWQSALPIEEVILENENILEAVVCNELNEATNSEIVSYLVLKDLNLAEDTISKIRRLFFIKKMRTLCPKSFYIVESLPKGITGKLKRGSIGEAKVIKKI